MASFFRNGAQSSANNITSAGDLNFSGDGLWTDAPVTVNGVELDVREGEVFIGGVKQQNDPSQTDLDKSIFGLMYRLNNVSNIKIRGRLFEFADEKNIWVDGHRQIAA